jgi:hypothetical protein
VKLSTRQLRLPRFFLALAFAADKPLPSTLRVLWGTAGA